MSVQCVDLLEFTCPCFIPNGVKQFSLKTNALCSSGSAGIVIQGSDTVFDLNGFTLAPAFGADLDVGIQLSGDQNLIKNGVIEGFDIGIEGSGDDLEFENLYLADISVGISLVGSEVVVVDSCTFDVETVGLGITDGKDVSVFDSLFNINGEEARGILLAKSKKVNVFSNLFDFAARPAPTGNEFNVGIYHDGSDKRIKLLENSFEGPTGLKAGSYAVFDAKKKTFIPLGSKKLKPNSSKHPTGAKRANKQESY